MANLSTMYNILDTIKQLLGVEASYDAFDVDITTFINGAIMTLSQLGIGAEDFSIADGDETWEDYLEDDLILLQGVKQYIYLSVRLVFDPPSTSFVIDSLNRQLQELTWRLTEQKEFPSFET